MLILTHIGNQYPKYIDDCLSQIRVNNPGIDVVLICNKKCSIPQNILSKNNVDKYYIEDLPNKKLLSYTQDDYDCDIDYGGGKYWSVTKARLFYLYEFTKKHEIDKYYYFENDIMLYESIEKIDKIIQEAKIYENAIAITRGGENKIMTGFVYVDKYKIMEDVLDSFFENTYKSQEELNEKYYFNNEIMNEMFLLSCFQYDNPDVMKHLPVFPGEDGFSEFNSLFDPASYGQILGGTPHSETSVWAPDHFIPKKMKENGCDIQICLEEDGRICPYLNCNESLIKVNTLHIHSKKLNLFHSIDSPFRISQDTNA